MSNPATQRQQNLLEPGVLVELFQIDLSSQGGPILYFHNSTVQGDGNIHFQGNTYTPWPMMGEGFEYTQDKAQPQPRVSVSNFGSTITTLLRQYGDFVGCPVIRKRVFAQFLDAPQGTTPNPNEEYIPDKFYVSRRSIETNAQVQFELATWIDIEAVQLPHRQIISQYCVWYYRGPDCGYTGKSIADKYLNFFGPTFTDGVISSDGSTISSATAAFTATDVGLVLSNVAAFKMGTTILSVAAGVATLSDFAILPGSTVSFTINRLTDRGAYSSSTTYNKWDQVYTVALNGARLYWVSLVASNTGQLTDPTHWAGDVCVKLLANGCKLHFGPSNPLPTSAFPGAMKVPPGA
jgi:lambda family phage minor tail protein L